MPSVKKKKGGYFREFTKGILKENPNMVTLLGMCPTLAITTSVFNGFGMGVATTFVMTLANITVSLMRKLVPTSVRLPVYIVVITAYVTIAELLVKAYVPALYATLGIFIPLIAANCILLGRLEVFASRNGVVKSTLDGLGMGVGFTLTLVLMGSVREILGAGKWFGLEIPFLKDNAMVVFILPAGGFFALGIIIAAVNAILHRKPPAELGCSGCIHSDSCALCGTGGVCDPSAPQPRD
ncbi:MAG: electron transport complex subunit E [Oscillospiraceae bacterium]